MAIQANELRIGNWVVSILSNDYKRVTAIKTHKANDGIFTTITLDYKSEKVSYIPEHIYPIPLSPELLEKAGLSPLNGTQFYYKVFDVGNRTIEISINPDNGVVYIDCQNEQIRLPREYKYFHDFQNLIYSLVGRELQIKM